MPTMLLAGVISLPVTNKPTDSNTLRIGFYNYGQKNLLIFLLYLYILKQWLDYNSHN